MTKNNKMREIKNKSQKEKESKREKLDKDIRELVVARIRAMSDKLRLSIG